MGGANDRIDLMPAERDLLCFARKFDSPEAFAIYLVENGLVNYRLCRVVVIKRHYRNLRKAGMPSMDAITATAVKYCISEETVKKAIYQNINLKA